MPSQPHCTDGRKLQRVSLEQHWKMRKLPIADPEIELFLENSWNLDGEAGTRQTQTPTRCYRRVRDVSRTSRVLERWSVHGRQAWAGRHPAAVSREHRSGRRLSPNIVGNPEPPPGDEHPGANRQAVPREGEFMTVYLETQRAPPELLEWWESLVS